MKLRISSGKFKNKNLSVPQSAKPVKERVKLAVFSMIGENIKDKHILDLFAGSGNLGLEALSRGAKSCVFVDDDYEAIGLLRNNTQNIKKAFGDIGEIRIEKSDATKYIANHDGYYDIIFVDPPYATHIIHILKYIHDSLTNNGLVIYFHDSNYTYDLSSINNKLKINDTRRYGITTVDFIKRT